MYNVAIIGRGHRKLCFTIPESGAAVAVSGIVKHNDDYQARTFPVEY